MQRSFARRAWEQLETLHAVVYFAPEKKPAYDAAGLEGGWMGYFAGRAAPLGPVSAEVVTAVFYNFHPAMVRRSIPDAWSFSSPEKVLEARLTIVDLALRRLLADVDDRVLAEAGALCIDAAGACDLAGRPLFAANAALDPPHEPHLRLWHAATMLREHRCDGHVAALVAAGLDGCEAHLTLAGTGAVAASDLQPHRNWSDDEWAAGRRRLVERGLLDETGMLTPDGAELRRWVEELTDEAALLPWRTLGEGAAERLLTLLQKPVGLVVERGGVPFPNPMGLPRPS